MTATAAERADRAAHLRRRLQASQLRLTDHHPFFGALLLFAPVVVTDAVETAATDGERLLFNPDFAGPLPTAQLDGLVVHELLHCALMHLHRRGTRDPLLWNIAADIHVNGAIRGLAHLDLPPGGVEEPPLASLCVEEIYEKILKSKPLQQRGLGLRDLQGTADDGTGKGRDSDGRSRSASEAAAAAHAAAEAAERMRTFWADAVQRAKAMAEMSPQCHGKLPAGVERLVSELLEPQQDWRTALWRYVVRTPDDFQGFDRRHLWQGLYVDALEGESIEVDVCVDTSGSVDAQLLTAFLSEVRGIVRAYPSVRCRLYYCDAACVGPFEVDAGGPIPVARGGGGTSFRPFFEATDPAREPHARAGAEPPVAVYLTDGFGDFPKHAPDRPVLWVVPPAGLASSQFPFGTVVRMRQST